MKYLRWLLLPFSWLYGIAVLVSNWCYDAGWLKSTAFHLPVISVGNLAVGGAGKSPMTEYLINLLKSNYKIATLSRGYGRRTQGFLLANANSTAADIGDEPAQFAHKFKDITVAVCEDRVQGINQLRASHDVIIMDDAYQHRAVKPGLSILLFDYNKLDDPNFLLPAGNLREPFSGKMRADIIVISKCPEGLPEDEQLQIESKVRPYPYQHLFFSAIKYQSFRNLDGLIMEITTAKGATIFLLTGIAGAQPVKQYLSNWGSNIVHHKYPDHHQFTLKNITKLANEFLAEPTENKWIVTTEKDAERLKQPELQPLIKKLNIMVLPISVAFLSGSKQFDQLVIDYVRKYTAHNSIH